MEIFMDLLNFPSYPDAGVSNWLMGGGGRLIRIDWDNPFMDVTKGEKYPLLLAVNVFCYQKDVFSRDLPHSECPPCKTCWKHSWAAKAPPNECHQCYMCVHTLYNKKNTPAHYITYLNAGKNVTHQSGKLGCHANKGNEVKPEKKCYAKYLAIPPPPPPPKPKPVATQVPRRPFKGDPRRR
eukprot:TRINITY_DN79247_c0_g1_i1.p1 TRINITY_DN79247_c0_g1~~TRINITY_DN79247_c0_g1_i1.p1  ORF type:complete len:209 (+),score=11.93 TRINITY_DN79247_c0_g1_i1:87-629(+)